MTYALFNAIRNVLMGKYRPMLFCATRDHSFSTQAKFSEKLILLTPLICTRTFAYQEL